MRSLKRTTKNLNTTTIFQRLSFQRTTMHSTAVMFRYLSGRQVQPPEIQVLNANMVLVSNLSNYSRHALIAPTQLAQKQ